MSTRYLLSNPLTEKPCVGPQIRMSESYRQWLARVAAGQGLSMVGLYTRALEEYVKRWQLEPPPARKLRHKRA